MFIYFKHKLIKRIEKIPLLQIFIYNNLKYLKFLFPHDKDYYALKILFPLEEKRSFIDVGGNIGLSTIGFRELGFKENRIYIFEPDKSLIKFFLNKIKRKYRYIKIYPFGLSNKNYSRNLYKAYYKKNFSISTIALVKTILKKNYFIIMEIKLKNLLSVLNF